MLARSPGTSIRRREPSATLWIPRDPTSAGSGNVDMGEGTTASRVGVKSGTANEFRIASFDALHRVQDHLHVSEVDLSVAVQVGHFAVPFLVDEDVGGVTELVAAVA